MLPKMPSPKKSKQIGTQLHAIGKVLPYKIKAARAMRRDDDVEVEYSSSNHEEESVEEVSSHKRRNRKGKRECTKQYACLRTRHGFCQTHESIHRNISTVS